MTAKYSIGDFLICSLGSFEGEEVIVEGIVAEVRDGSPPNHTSAILPVETYCYRFKGERLFVRESCVIARHSYATTALSYPPAKPCVLEPLTA